MPLTAILDGVVPVDSTQADAADWAELHKVRPRRDLRCRECGAHMHAKTSSAGLQFFAHDREASNCSSLGETAEHRQLKQMLAELIRELGFTAEIEAMPQAADAGGWRADVLGSSDGGARVAFEVQLAAMTVEEGERRTARYAADGIACLWVSPRHASWMTCLPSCHLVPDSDGFSVDRGLARFSDGRWERAGVVPLRKLVRGLLANAIVAVQSDYFSEVVSGRTLGISPACLLVARLDAARSEAHDERIRREDHEQERRRIVHETNRRALIERQERVLQRALGVLLATGVEPSQVWLGIPSRPWGGEFPVPLSLAVGNGRTAQGAAIWVWRDGGLGLWGVVCPVADRASPSLGSSWRRRSTQVFVESGREASRIGRALGWPQARIRVAPDE